MGDWHVYLVQCSDDTLYTGITTDIARRIEEHNSSDQLGARYTRSRRPVKLIYQEQVESRSSAAKREAAIRKLGRKGKEKLIRHQRG